MRDTARADEELRPRSLQRLLEGLVGSEQAAEALDAVEGDVEVVQLVLHRLGRLSPLEAEGLDVEDESRHEGLGARARGSVSRGTSLHSSGTQVRQGM